MPGRKEIVEPVEGQRIAEQRACSGDPVEGAVFDEVVNRDGRRDREQTRAAGVRVLEADLRAGLGGEVGGSAAVLEEGGIDDHQSRVAQNCFPGFVVRSVRATVLEDRRAAGDEAPVEGGQVPHRVFVHPLHPEEP
jgi:hypothetical protein